MKNNPFTRFLSVALTAVMLVGVMPGAVLADAGEAIVGASSAVVESIPESTTPADAAPVATEVPPVTEPEATPEAAQPEASPEVEAAPEAAEQPETTPEATQEPEATPEATEEPETVDAQALLDELMALDDQAFLAAVDALTEEQAAALEALGEEALANLFARLDVLTAEPEDAPVDYNAMSVEELYAYLRSLTDDTIYTNVWNSLTEQKRMDVLDYAESVSSGASFEVVRDIDRGILNFSNAAPLMELVTPVMAKTMARSMLLSLPEVSNNFNTVNAEQAQGLEINKKIKTYDSDSKEGILELEAYVTGSVTTVTESKPVDIVLVLDQSGSMSYTFGTQEVTKYTQSDVTNSTAYDRSNANWDSVQYYMHGADGNYYPVIITRGNETKQAVSGSTTLEQLYNSRNSTTYYYEVNGNFVPVSIKRERGIFGTTYSVTYGDWWDEETIISGNGSTILSSEQVTLYTLSYTYQYNCPEVFGENNPANSQGANGMPPETLYTKSVERERALDALITAVNGFVSSVKTDAETNSVDHRIAIVGYSSSGYSNTEVLTVDTITESEPINGGTYYYPKAKRMDGIAYSNGPDYWNAVDEALRSVNDSNGYTVIENAIGALTAHGGTQTLDGLDMAYDILNAQQEQYGEQYQKGERKQVVVLFTDGDTDSDRDDTIRKAKDLKDLGATVYTVGIFANADGSIVADNQGPYIDQGIAYRPGAYSRDDWYWSWDWSSEANKLMHAVSSNYPNAVRNNSLGTINANLANQDGTYSSYFLSASDSASLSNVFEQISSQVGGATNTSLNSSTVLFDKMSEYVKLLEGVTQEDIIVKTVAAVGRDQNGTVQWSNESQVLDNAQVYIDEDTGIVQVSGFDYSANYVGERLGEMAGYKIVVEIPFVADMVSYGGNNIPTNAKTSGIYNSDGSQCYGNFEVPAVNVPVNYEIGVQHQTIYISNAAQLDDLMKYASDFYTPDGVKNAFVSIEYTLAKGGVTIATLSIPAGQPATGKTWQVMDGQTLNPSDLVDCTDYTISCTVTPVDRGFAKFGTQAVQKTCTPETATVHVLKPVITWKDTTKDYNAAIPDDLATTDENLVKVEWPVCGCINAPAVTGTKPTLAYTFTLANNKPLPTNITEELHVKVAVTANSMPLTGGNVKFEWQKNDASTGCTASCVDPNPAYQFRIHLGTGTLIINKVVSKFANNGKPVFDFKVTSQGADGTVYYFHIDMTEKAADTPAEVEKITLPAGQYKVEELNNLNYPLQYVTGIDKNGGTVSVGGEAKTVTFTNQGKDTNIPTDGSAAVNTFQTDNNGDYILSFKKEELGADPQTPAVGN